MPDRIRSATAGIAATTVPHAGLLGPRYFLHLIGPPSLVLAAMSAAAPTLPALRGALAPFCHQIVARSFCVDGRPFGLCARCTGIYLGIAATWLGLGALARRPLLLAAAEAPAYALAVVSLALWSLGIEVDNAFRFAFGLALGAAGAFVLWRTRTAMLVRFGGRPAGAALSFLPIVNGKSER